YTSCSLVALLALAIFVYVAYQHQDSNATDESSMTYVMADNAVRITVGSNVQVSKRRATIPHAEVILATDATTPARLLAGSIIEQPGAGDSVVAYISHDGGKTWELALEKRAAKGGPKFLDPTVAFDANGVAHFAALGLGSGKPYLEI